MRKTTTPITGGPNLTIERIAIRLTLWLVRRFNICVLSEARRRSSADAVERGARWQAFYEEEGGLRDMLLSIRREAFEAATEIDPRETEKVYYTMMADRNLRKLDQRIQQVIVTGKTEAENRRNLERMNAARIVR